MAKRKQKIINSSSFNISGPVQRHRVSTNTWIELPVGLGKREVKARIDAFVSRLNQSKQVYNPKA